MTKGRSILAAIVSAFVVLTFTMAGYRQGEEARQREMAPLVNEQVATIKHLTPPRPPAEPNPMMADAGLYDWSHVTDEELRAALAHLTFTVYPRMERVDQFEWRFYDVNGRRWQVLATGHQDLPLTVSAALPVRDVDNNTRTK